MSGSAQIMTTAIRTPENTEQASIERKILWLKISFWIGAILDAMFYIDVFVGSMFDSKSIFSWIFTLEDANFTDEYRFSLGLVGSLMLAWTFLLIWGARKPVARKDILPLTIIVFIGLIISNVLAYNLDLFAFAKLLRRLISQIALITLFAFSYWNARNLE
ncbi:MAG: hypothetical protein ACXAB7_01220 [Candidatus Kariarchaeaceae archaeon]|jgi:hypothetical protein